MSWSHSSAPALLLVVASVGACITGTIADGGGGEGSGGNEVAASSTSGSPSGAGGGSSVASGPGGGGGDDGECRSPDDCPGLDTSCRHRTCLEAACGFEDADAGTVCTENGGQKCDGLGSCVECLESADCAEGICQQNQCVPATCSDTVQNGSETDVDCGGMCAPCANGDGCTTASDCSSGYCDGGSCSPCSGDGQCAPSEHCSAGSCVDDKPLGDLCSGANQCQSGFCPAQDGVCCDSACSGGCVACVAGKTGAANGSCDAVLASTDPDGECAAQGPSTCGSNGTGCNGSSQSPGCQLYPSGTTCSQASCSGGQETAAGTCNGSGSCNPGSSSPCSPYVCGSNACLTSCSGNSQCVSGYVCSGGSCVPQQTGGSPCSSPSQCSSGHCVDGRCCNSACTGTCRVCDLAGNLGTCSYVPANTDPDNECSGSDVCDGAGQCGPQCLGAGPSTTPLDSEEQTLLALINQHRANNGAGPLSACTSLNRAAQGHSEDMRDQNYFSHTGLNGSSPWDRACWACYDHGCGPSTAMAENIAAGNSGAQGTFNQWLNSPGHNSNMLNPNFTVIGIGRATGGGMYGSYWTNVFGGTSEPSCN